MTILAACGLKREARIIARAGFMVVAGGGDGATLERELEIRVATGEVTAILSIGLAGALDPALKVGDVVLQPSCAMKDVTAALLHARHGMVAGRGHAVASIREKQDLFTTGAIAVDMETHIVTRVAGRHDLPFAAIRVISDDGETMLPPAALVGMRDDGGVAFGAVLASLARHPGQLRSLIRTARDAGRAFRTLRSTVDALPASMSAT